MKEYSTFFDASSIYFEKDSYKNLMFLKMKQEQANIILRIKGFITINEILVMIGLEKIFGGDTIGWYYDKDTHIDFGIYNLSNRYFVNGYEYNALLKFNVNCMFTR